MRPAIPLFQHRAAKYKQHSNGIFAKAQINRTALVSNHTAFKLQKAAS
jgi:hypothetical protein